MDNKEFKSESGVGSKRRVAVIFSQTAIFIALLLFSAYQKHQEKFADTAPGFELSAQEMIKLPDFASKKAPDMEDVKPMIECPHCGEYVTELYLCTNSDCPNSDPEWGVGCTNPDIDSEGNPKCLYKYAYGAYCRRCDGKARVYSRAPRRRN